uniref:Uncharacterized protein n=1 Tax=Anguilla anguilla TaxID=7936 RepID=A0A0E9W593_ANGAN
MLASENDLIEKCDMIKINEKSNFSDITVAKIQARSIIQTLFTNSNHVEFRINTVGSLSKKGGLCNDSGFRLRSDFR